MPIKWRKRRVNRQTILLAAMGVVLIVFFGEPILKLFDKGPTNQPVQSQFKLTGISKAEDGYMAIINDEIMQKGSKMLGFTIAKISDSEVRLKRNRDRITLELIE